MKKVYLFCLFGSFFTFISCHPHAEPLKTTDEHQQLIQKVNTFIDQWHQSATDADFASYFQSIAPDGIFVGTAAEEVWTKKEFEAFAAPYFEKGKTWDFKKIERQVYTTNNEFIWFNETLNTWMGVCRGSGTLYLNPNTNRLEIKQYVLSLTVPNDRIQSVIQAIEQPSK